MSFPGDSAFSSWTYRVDYSELEGTLETVRESALDITLTDLQPGTSYQFMITAKGPGGEKQNLSSLPKVMVWNMVAL